MVGHWYNFNLFCVCYVNVQRVYKFRGKYKQFLFIVQDFLNCSKET